MDSQYLLECVELSIHPDFQDWVLFKNGTYIIFDNTDTVSDIEREAVNLMKEYGPVYAGGAAGDFNVIHLDEVEGWVVSGHCYGMYTYVNPSELGDKNEYSDIEIGLFGRAKRDLDGKNPEILHVSRKH